MTNVNVKKEEIASIDMRRLGVILLVMSVVVANGVRGLSQVATDASWTIGNITIDHAWARIVPGARTGAVYLRITNTGHVVDRLVAVSSSAASSTTLHETTTADGVTSMAALHRLKAAPGAPITLKPGGRHVMLEGINSELKVGEVLPLKLVLQKAGAISIAVPVLPLDENDPYDQQ